MVVTNKVHNKLIFWSLGIHYTQTPLKCIKNNNKKLQFPKFLGKVISYSYKTFSMPRLQVQSVNYCVQSIILHVQMSSLTPMNFNNHKNFNIY